MSMKDKRLRHIGRIPCAKADEMRYSMNEKIIVRKQELKKDQKKREVNRWSKVYMVLNQLIKSKSN